MDKKEADIVQSGLQSVPMTIIMKLKKQMNFLLILNLILTLGFIISVYDSIKVRDDYWNEHTEQVVDVIHAHCETEAHEWQD